MQTIQLLSLFFADTRRCKHIRSAGHRHTRHDGDKVLAVVVAAVVAVLAVVVAAVVAAAVLAAVVVMAAVVAFYPSLSTGLQFKSIDLGPKCRFPGVTSITTV